MKHIILTTFIVFIGLFSFAQNGKFNVKELRDNTYVKPPKILQLAKPVVKEDGELAKLLKSQNKQSEKECSWDLTQIPRIVFAPGCSGNGSRLCRGMVICGNKKRLATCSENFCTADTATECVKQKGYSHRAIQDDVQTKN